MKWFHFTNEEARDDEDGVVSRSSKVSWVRSLSLALRGRVWFRLQRRSWVSDDNDSKLDVAIKQLNRNGSFAKGSSLEHVLVLVMSHIGQRPCICPNSDLQWSFTSQILTIPFLWQLFSYLKQVFTTRDPSQCYIHQMALCAKGPAKVLPIDRSVEFPGYACLLGNVMDTAALTFAQPDCSFDLAMDFAVVAASLLEELSPIQTSNTGSKENFAGDEDEMIMDDEFKEKVLNKDLERQISNAIDPHFFLH